MNFRDRNAEWVSWGKEKTEEITAYWCSHKIRNDLMHACVCVCEVGRFEVWISMCTLRWRRSLKWLHSPTVFVEHRTSTCATNPLLTSWYIPNNIARIATNSLHIQWSNVDLTQLKTSFRFSVYIIIYTVHKLITSISIKKFVAHEFQCFNRRWRAVAVLHFYCILKCSNVHVSVTSQAKRCFNRMFFFLLLSFRLCMNTPD